MSQSPIFNASSRALNVVSGDVPDVSGALFSYFQDMTFNQITKSVVNFQLVETEVSTDFQGLMMPYTAQELKIVPEGQRAWIWFHCFTQINLGLKPDDIITYLGFEYRVMGRRDYSLYGYYDYSLVQDYTGGT